MYKLIFVEGLPGTGKTTIAKWLFDCLEEKRNKVVLLLEGDTQIPCDFYEMAGMTKSVFDEMCEKYPEICDDIKEQAIYATGYVFLRIDKAPEIIKNELRYYDMGDEANINVSVTDYIPCALARLDAWVDNIKNTEDIIIIDSGFLQNPINELLFRNATENEVEVFIREIAKRVQTLNPFCVYLHRSNAKDSIAFAEKAKGEEWTNRVQALLKETGHENFFELRFTLEEKILSTGILDWVDCFVSENDWSLAKEKIKSTLIDKLTE